MTNLQPHIQCGEEDAAKYAVLPGDPQRVDRIGKFLTDVKEIAFNREYKSIVGYYKGVRIIVVSTGIGGASTGIAVEELKNIGVESMIRIGSCGALQKNIHLGDLIIVNGAVRDEGTTKAYIESIYPAIPDTELLYTVIDVAKTEGVPFHVGRARSHDSFYTENESRIDAYWAECGILGADMETAALFTIGGLRGLKTASVLNTVVECDGNLQEDISHYVNGETLMAQGEEREILVALEAFVKMEHMKKQSEEKAEI